MSEQLHGQIDTKQQEIETLKGPAEAKKKIREHRATYVGAVDSGQRELKTAAGKLKSPEAQAFLTKASGEISGHLTSMATRGRDIIKAHEEAKEGEKPVNVPSLDDLSGKLKGRLSGLKASIDSFKLIEEVKEEEEKIGKDNDKLNDSDGSVAPTNIYKAKKKLLEKISGLEPKIKVTADSRGYWEGVRKAHLDLHSKINDESLALAVPMVDEGTINDFKANAEAYVKLAKQYESSPSDALKQQLQAAAANVDIEKVSADVFTEPTRGSENYEQKFYSHLWDTYTAAKDSFEKAQSSLESKEKEELMAEAKVAAGAYEKAWQTSIQPDFDKYVAMKPEEQNKSDLEKSLLSKLLQSKQLLSKYSSADAKEALDYETSELINKHLEEIGWNIKKIEGLRSEFLNEKDFKKDDVSKYVSFPTREGYRTVNETYYDFTPAFYKLSKAEQIRVKQLVERIASKNLDSVKKDTAKEQLKFLNPEEKMKQLKEMMGEKGKLYWSAYEKMKGKDPESAIPDFQAYADQSFSAEEMEVHGDMIADAKEKVKGFHTGHILTIEGLLRDVKEMKYAHGRMVGRPEIKPDEWTEVNEIEKELTLFKDEISKGEVKDFKARYDQMTKKVRDALAHKKIDETGILKWMNHLHDATQEKDPEKRKKAFVEFAKEARYYQGYNLAKKYLDYAIAEESQKFAKDVTRDSVLKKMLAEEDFVHNLEQNTKAQYNAMIKNDPSLADNLTMKDVRDLLIERALKGRYALAVRRKMTTTAGVDNIDSDSALGLYNNWFPLDEPAWYKPWDYGAQEWDEFQIECAKFAFETVSTLGIGAGASTMGRIGAKQGGKFVMKYLMRQGLKQAEIEIIERGGLLALRKAVMEGGKQTGKKWLSRQTLSFAASRLVAGVGLEAATMTALGTTQQFLQVGPQMFEGRPGDFLAKEFLRSMAFSTIFRGLGVVHNIKPLANAMGRGGAMGKAAFLGAETLSGGAGVVIEYAFAKAQGHEFTGKDAFKSMISNYAMAVGMGAIHRPPGGGKDKVTENYRKQVAADFQKSTGIDFNKASTIKTARVTPDGQLIVNGKAMKDFDVQSLAHLPKKARERILDLAPDNALDTHYKSNFSVDVPKELLPDGDSARANEVHGWIGVDGKIHYNLSHLNTGHSEGGPYRGKKILPEGHTARVNKSGDMVIEGPGGKEMSFHQFLKTPEGKNSPLLAEMKRIKHHEAIHQVLEAMYTKASNGERIVDPSKTKSLTDMFARPDLDGRLPEGKIPLVDHNGKPMDVTWQNVQEYLCHVGDGSIKTSAPHKKAFESAISQHVPGFTFAKARQLSTKALASHPAEAFKRTSAAAKQGDTPDIEVHAEVTLNTDSPKTFVESLDKGLAQKGTRKATSELVQMFLGFAHGRVDYKSMKATFPHLKADQILGFSRALTEGYTQRYDNLSNELALAMREGPNALKKFDKSLNSADREYVKAILDEAKHSNRLLTSKNPADVKLLKKLILSGKKGIGRHHIESLARTENGRAFLKEVMAANKKMETGIHGELTAIYGEKIMSRYPHLDPAALNHLVSGRVDVDAMSLIAHDSKKLLKLEHVEGLIHGEFPAERVVLLEKNIHLSKMTAPLAEKMLSFEPEVTSVHGKKVEFYDAHHIGNGGLARVFEAAIIGENGQLNFVGCKKSHDGGPQTAEADTARLMFKMTKQGLDTSHIMEYKYVSDDESLIFFDIHSYKTPDGKEIVGDLKELSRNPDVPAELIYQGLLGGAEALAAFEAQGIIQMDTKIDNYVIGTGPDGKPRGVHIDLGFAIPREQAINAQLGMPTIDNGWILGQFPVGIGVTPGYYNTEVMTLIIQKKVPPEKHHNYTFGVALEVMLTGHNKMNKFTVVKEGSSPSVDPDATVVGKKGGPVAPGSSAQKEMVMTPHRVTDARALPTPPYPQDANAKLMNLSQRLKDPYDPITMEQAVVEMKQVLASKQKK